MVQTKIHMSVKPGKSSSSGACLRSGPHKCNTNHHHHRHDRLCDIICCICCFLICLQYVVLCASRVFKWFHDDIGVQFFPHIIDQLCKYYLPLWRFWYHSATTPPTWFQHLFHWAIEANIQWLKHWSHATLWWPQHRFYGIVLGVVGGPFAKTRKCI